MTCPWLRKFAGPSALAAPGEAAKTGRMSVRRPWRVHEFLFALAAGGLVAGGAFWWVGWPAMADLL